MDNASTRPLFFTSRAWLDCSISSTKPGRQTMRTTNGQGFNFDMEMMPINDGMVKLQPPGMHYKFTAFPSGRVPAESNATGSQRDLGPRFASVRPI